MRNWKRRYRAKHKNAYTIWFNSDSSNYNPRLKLFKKSSNFTRNIQKKRLEFVKRELISKEYYEDCAYHICQLSSIDMDDGSIVGKSLIDGSEPRSCSLFDCGVIFFTEIEALGRLRIIREQGFSEYIKMHP